MVDLDRNPLLEPGDCSVDLYCLKEKSLFMATWNTITHVDIFAVLNVWNGGRDVGTLIDKLVSVRVTVRISLQIFNTNKKLRMISFVLNQDRQKEKMKVLLEKNLIRYST